jgi:hypothetical protein
MWPWPGPALAVVGWFACGLTVGLEAYGLLISTVHVGVVGYLVRL